MITRHSRSICVLVVVLLLGLLLPAAVDPGAASAQADPVLVGAGDIADCGLSSDDATANLLDNIAGTVFTLGDNAYPTGSDDDFANCYDPTWGRQQARTRPAPGNHDYNQPGAQPYFDYFGANAGPANLGWYSYNLGAWHIIVLNSQVSTGQGGSQDQWLRADLAANPSTCTLAYWHYPVYGSGGGLSTMSYFWRLLYDSGVDVVMNGHNHQYERLAPLNATGQADFSRGMREFVVGTGGDTLDGGSASIPTSQSFNGNTFGVLKLTLHATNYDWQFIPVAGQSFTDSGNASCINNGTGAPNATATRTATRTPTTVPGATATRTPTVNATLTPTATSVTTGCVVQPISYGQTDNGNLTLDGCRSNLARGPDFYAGRYSFDGAAGDQIAISMTSSELDTYLTLFDPSGTAIAFNDDSNGTMSSRIPATSGTLVLTTNGTYLIDASTFQAGTSGAYTVSLAGSSSGPSATPTATASSTPLAASPTATRTLSPTRTKAPVTGTPTRTATVVTSATQTPLQTATPTRTVGAPSATPTATAAGVCTTVPIQPGQTLSGSLASTDCVSIGRGNNYYADRYTFFGNSGDQVVIAMQSTAFDTYLHLVGPSGTVVAVNDDNGTGGTSSRIPAPSGAFSLPAAGTYTIDATSFRTQATGVYSVSLTSTGSGVASPTSTSAVQSTATATRTPTSELPTATALPGGCTSVPISSGQTLSGTLSTTDCTSLGRGTQYYADRFTFAGTAGQQVVITLQSSAFDTYLHLLNPSGVVVAYNDDSNGSTNSRIPVTSGSFSLPVTGTYTIDATTFRTLTTGGYTVSLTVS